MKVRFQADADLNETILRVLRREEPAVKFQTARAAGLEGLADPDVLAVAQREERVLVTHDARTMPGHFSAFRTFCSKRTGMGAKALLSWT
jgi:predicted nuclease of predicted toxin-antitoxin system